MNSNTNCLHVIISGKVQGVGYRYSTAKKAAQLGITGWVRNLTDGTVEAIFEGNQESLEMMIAWCYQGPVGAKVTDIIINNLQVQGFNNFEIRG